MLRRAIVFASLSVLLPAGRTFGQPAPSLAPPDRYDWLNKADDPRAAAWAAAQTAATMRRLTQSPVFPAVQHELSEAERASRSTPGYFLLGEHIVRFTRDASHPRGVFAVASIGGTGGDRDWHDVLDVAAMNQQEGRDFEVMFLDLNKTCLAPRFERCLLPFGAGGSSLIQYREFDFATGRFVVDGFVTTPSRGGVAWLDRDTLLIAHANDPSGLLPSGFPKSVYRWRRGTPLASADTVMTAASTDSLLDVRSLGASLPGRGLILRAKDYATFELYQVARDGAPSRLDLPTKLQGFGETYSIGSTLVVQLASDAEIEGRPYAADTLVGYDLQAPIGARASTVYVPARGRYVSDPFSGIAATRNALAFVVTEHLGKTLVVAMRDAAGWAARAIRTASPGATMKLPSSDQDGNRVLVEEAGLLEPTEVALASTGGAAETLFRARPLIDASRFVSEVRSAQSSDGTSIDYYLVRPRAARPGPVPAILYGYGGYGVNADPSYFEGGLGPALVSWLSRGGAYAIAAIRGGSERGSAWALAAKGTNRQRSFDDFAAVAQSMIASGFTTREHLGCMGRSFGGLLAANMVTQHPDLFGAVLVGVPITDLFRLGTDKNDISAGQKIEVGDWTDPQQMPLMLRYSPYQNIRAGVRYPAVLAVESARDGQVGPGHARRFVAKLQSAGADARLIEGPTGGHGFPNEFTNPVEYAAQVTFFIDTLMVKAPAASSPSQPSSSQ